MSFDKIFLNSQWKYFFNFNLTITYVFKKISMVNICNKVRRKYLNVTISKYVNVIVRQLTSESLWMGSNSFLIVVQKVSCIQPVTLKHHLQWVCRLMADKYLFRKHERWQPLHTWEWEGEKDSLSEAMTTFAPLALISDPVIATDQWAPGWN